MTESIMLRVDDSCISEKFEELRQLKVMCDIELRSLDGSTFNAHKIVLSARCNYFSTMLSSSFQEAKQSVIKIDESAEIIEELLRYIYSGVVRITGDTAQDLLRVGNQYNIQALFLAVENYITENIDAENCVPLIRTARQLNAQKLERGALEFVEKSLKIVSKFDQMNKKDVTAMIVKEEIDFDEIFLQFLNWFSVRKDEETAIDIFRQLNFGRLNKDHVNRMMQVFGNTLSCIRVIGQKLAEDWEPRETLEKFAVEKRKDSLDCSGLAGQCRNNSVCIGSPRASYCGFLGKESMQPMKDIFNNEFFVSKVGDNSVLIRKGVESDSTCFVFVSRGEFASFTYCHFTAEQPWCELTLQDAGTDSSHYTIYIGTCDIPQIHYTTKNCHRGGEVAVQEVSYTTSEKEVLVTCQRPLRNGRHGLLITGRYNNYRQLLKVLKWHEFEQQEASSEGLKAQIFGVKFKHPNYYVFNYVLWEISD